MKYVSMPRTGLFLVLGLTASACGIAPYGGPNDVIATGSDRGFFDRTALVNGEAAIAYDPDGCQNWIIDDGLEGYSSPRYDPASGLPICNNRYPPGTVSWRIRDPFIRTWRLGSDTLTEGGNAMAKAAPGARPFLFRAMFPVVMGGVTVLAQSLGTVTLWL